MTALAYIGLGANLGDGVDTFCRCVDKLTELGGIELVAVSPLYRSAAVDYVDQPDFLNAVIGLKAGFPATDLLAHLRRLETLFDRQRPFPKAPRTLDLDLLLYGDTITTTESLTVPHPEMTRRAFVLRPLLAIDPTLSLPGNGLLADYLGNCRDQVIETFDDVRWHRFSSLGSRACLTQT